MVRVELGGAGGLQIHLEHHLPALALDELLLAAALGGVGRHHVVLAGLQLDLVRVRVVEAADRVAVDADLAGQVADEKRRRRSLRRLAARLAAPAAGAAGGGRVGLGCRVLHRRRQVLGERPGGDQQQHRQQR